MAAHSYASKMQGPGTAHPTDGDEDLFALEDHPNATKDEVRKTFHRLRPATQAETDLSMAAEQLLRRMTVQSGYADLTRAAEILFDEIRRSESERGDWSDRERQAARLQREFKAWLSAFRAFDDRTSNWLSERFGKTSAVYEAFKALLSYEFDNNFGYRLCCALRNVSEHQADVINDLRFHAGLSPDSGQPEPSVSLRFDGPRLANDFPKKIRAATRNELQQCERPLELVRVVKAVMLSSEQVHAGLFLALWPEIESAVTNAEDAHREAVEAGGDWAVFINRSAYVGLGEGPSRMSMRHNAYDLALMARQNQAQTTAIRQVPLGTLKPTDFMV